MMRMARLDRALGAARQRPGMPRVVGRRVGRRSCQAAAAVRRGWLAAAHAQAAAGGPTPVAARNTPWERSPRNCRRAHVRARRQAVATTCRPTFA